MDAADGRLLPDRAVTVGLLLLAAVDRAQAMQPPIGGSLTVG
jgi:hypothetical protein